MSTVALIDRFVENPIAGRVATLADARCHNSGIAYYKPVANLEHLAIVRQGVCHERIKVILAREADQGSVFLVVGASESRAVH
jgi:hypothetical protein